MKITKWLLACAVLAASGSAAAWERDHAHFGVYFGGPGPYWGGPWGYRWGPWGYPPPYSPYYYPPYYPPAVVVQSQPPVYIEQSPPAVAAPAPAPAPAQQNYWYYCTSAKGYYPYVKECPGGWQRVQPQPPQ